MKRLIIFLLAFTIFLLLFITPSHSNNIHELNAAIEANGARWVAKETPFSQIPKEERGKWIGALDASDLFGKPVNDSFYALLSVPSSFDWTENGGNYVTSIKDQGPCAACGIFTWIAVMESKFLIAHDMPGFDLNLSEQIVLSCSGDTNCQRKGTIEGILGFLESTGTYLETCYPYVATDGDCSKACANWEINKYRIDRWEFVVRHDVVPRADQSVLKNALYTSGPLSVQMNVYEDFLNYGEGIYSYTSGQYMGTHYVLLVGWDDAKGAFKCKNSWGTNWGEEGFFWISYSELYGTGPAEFGRIVIALGNVLSPITINISVTPTVVNFANINVGQSANRTITITNQTNSTAALTGNVGSLSAPFSVVSGGGGFNLYPGQSLSVGVQFTPTSAVTASGSLSIIHNAKNQGIPINIKLSGTRGGSSGGNSGGGGGGGCFIATAAYGSYSDPHVMLLRKFRDNYLLTNPVGRKFVRLYYKTSPSIANYIRENEYLKAVIRWALTAIIYNVRFPKTTMILLGAVIGTFTYRKFRRRMR